MFRERALKIVLLLVGLLFMAAIFPAVGGVVDPAHSDTGDSMMMGIYCVLGIFLLLAARNPSAHRSLIAFAAWSSFAHAVVMSVQAYLGFIARRELIGSAVFILIGVALIALAPTKQSSERTVAVGA